MEEEIKILDFNDEELLENFWDWTADITARTTGLKVDIWSIWGGINRQKEGEQPYIELGRGEYWNRYILVITISPTPKIIAKTPDITDEQMKDLQEGIDYVAKNYDLFLKHFNDKDDSFDDMELLNALKQRDKNK